MKPPQPVDLMLQRQFGRYEILQRIGSGGMGEVYRARDLTLGREVAIKVVREQTSGDPDRLQRFEQEARSASALNHPNIVTIHEIGSVDGIRYIAMELVEGRTLREILHEGPLLTRRALQLAAQAADGLAQAHAANIVHRDLKPENIMVTDDGRVKILDFGLAKLMSPLPDQDAPTQSGKFQATAPGRIMGTASYMSPEQAMGHAADFRSDLFSCGAILYEMATGRCAFRRPSFAQTLTAIIEDDPEPIGSLNPAVPPPLRWIIERCLAKDPGERYASTRDLARDLEGVLAHLAEVSPSPHLTGTERTQAKAILSRRALIVGLVVAVSVVAVARWMPRPVGSPTQALAVSAGSAARHSVAMLGFKNLSGQVGTAWLSTALAEMLSTELAAGGRLRTIPGENVGRMKMELSLADAQSLAKDTLAQVGRNLGTDLVLIGSYVTLPESRLRIDLRLQEVAEGESVAVLAESGTEAELIDLVTRVGSRLRQSMGVEEPPTAEGRVVAAGAPSNLEAQRLFAQGLAKLRVLEALAARDLLQKAAAADPQTPMIHVALADAWAMLGYDARAREEAQRALDVSTGLPREQRLAVEARYREMAGEWDKAIEIYGALLAFFPDNVEYGLRLASAQSTGGRGDDALATLDRLRRLPAPAPRDARIDLAEAVVAQSRGDFKRQLAAARRAANEGNAQGARLLVAQARMREEYALDRLGEVHKATIAAEEARRIYAEAGDRVGLAWTLNGIGTTAWFHGDLEKARSTWEEALAVRREIGHRSGVAVSLHNLGLVFWEQGDLAGARRNLEEGHAIDRELGDRSGLAFNLESMAGLLAELGDLAGAEKKAQQAAALAREIGDRTEAAVVLMRQASIRQAEGDLAAAEAQYREALAVMRERGIRDSVAETLCQLGGVLEAKGDLGGARKHQEEALAIRVSLRAAFETAKSQLALARLAIEEGRAASAEPLLRDALAVFAKQRAADAEALAYAVLARSLLALGKSDDALRALETAAALAGRSQSPHVRLAVAVSAARVHAAHGRKDVLPALGTALAEAHRLRLVGLQLEIRLAQGEVLARSDGTAAARDLTVLARDARAKGFGLMARKAEAIAGARPAESPGAP